MALAKGRRHEKCHSRRAVCNRSLGVGVSARRKMYKRVALKIVAENIGPVMSGDWYHDDRMLLAGTSKYRARQRAPSWRHRR